MKAKKQVGRDFNLRIHKMKRSNFLRFLLLFFVLLGPFIAWKAELRAQARPTLAVIPALVERESDPARGAVCPICEKGYRGGNIPSGSRDAFNRLRYEKAEEAGKFLVIENERSERELSRVGMREFEKSPVPASIRIGRDLGVDFVLLSFLYRFEERIGSSLGVEKAASVGFDLHLYRIRDGKMVWQERFDETQQPLSEDLLKLRSFVRRKASWLKAEELAGVGMDEIFGRLPNPRELLEQP